MRQAEGVQPVAQVRREVHEDLPGVSRHLPLDGQDRHRQQSGGQALNPTSDNRHSVINERNIVVIL